MILICVDLQSQCIILSDNLSDYFRDVSDVVLIDPLTEDLFSYEQNVWSLFWLVPKSIYWLDPFLSL